MRRVIHILTRCENIGLRVTTPGESLPRFLCLRMKNGDTSRSPELTVQPDQ
jgi:hypothetical protein